MNVYFIPGIGADQRLFKYMDLPQGFEIAFIQWVEPKPKETLASYAARLAGQIDSTKPFVLVGMSFGGMLAVEISKILPSQCTILISSIPVAAHLPFYYRLAYKFKIHRILPGAFWKLSTICKHYLNRRSWKNKKYLGKIIREGNSLFIRWGINAVFEWDNQSLPNHLYQIHGSSDGVLPLRFTRPTHIVKGGHMLVIYQPDEINQILGQILAPVLSKQNGADDVRQ